jgi:hypothetical protein
MKLESGQFAKHANAQLLAMQKILQDLAQGPAAREIRDAAVTPFLKQQGEFLAGSGKTLSDMLSEYIPGLAPRMQANPISDTAVGLGLGGLGGFGLGQLLQSEPPQGRY